MNTPGSTQDLRAGDSHMTGVSAGIVFHDLHEILPAETNPRLLQRKLLKHLLSASWKYLLL